MSPEALVTELKNSLCAEVTIKSRGRDDYSVFVPFCFADGDALKIVLKCAVDGSYLLTDEGHTLMYLSYQDIDIDDSPARRDLLEKILSSHFMEERDGRLVMPYIASKDLAPAVFTFTQGLLKIGDMTLWKKERLKSMFMENFKQVFTSVAKDRSHLFDYNDKQIDPEKMYLIDCRMTGKNGVILHVYAAYSDAKAKDAMLSMYYYSRHGDKAFSCAVFDSETDMGIKTRNKVADIADKTISSLAVVPEAFPIFLSKCETLVKQ
jgi:hypothetical protein